MKYTLKFFTMSFIFPWIMYFPGKFNERREKSPLNLEQRNWYDLCSRGVY